MRKVEWLNHKKLSKSETAFLMNQYEVSKFYYDCALKEYDTTGDIAELALRYGNLIALLNLYNLPEWQKQTDGIDRTYANIILKQQSEHYQKRKEKVVI